MIIVSIFRTVQWVTDAAAAVCGEEARDGYIRAKIHEREKMKTYKTKGQMLATM
jgi:hypothetical protein